MAISRFAHIPGPTALVRFLDRLSRSRLPARRLRPSKAVRRWLAGYAQTGMLAAVVAADREALQLVPLPHLPMVYQGGGWKAVQTELLDHALVVTHRGPSARMVEQLRAVLQALQGALFAERLGFLVGRCRTGRHWFVSHDAHVRTCAVHRRERRRAAWRKWRDSPQGKDYYRRRRQRKPRRRRKRQ